MYTVIPRFLKFDIVWNDTVPQVRKEWRVLEIGTGGTSPEEKMRASSPEILSVVFKSAEDTKMIPFL